MYYVNLTPNATPSTVTALASLPNELSDALYSQTSDQSLFNVSRIMDNLHITGFIVDDSNVPPTMHTFLKELSNLRGGSIVYKVVDGDVVLERI